MKIQRKTVSGRGSIVDRALENVLLTVLLMVSALFTVSVVVSSTHPWLGYLGLTPIFMVIRSLRPLRAAIGGAFWGTCLFLFSVAIPDAIWSISISALFPFVAIPFAYVTLAAIFTHRFGYSPLALALGCVVVELVIRAAGLTYGPFLSNGSYGPFFGMVADFLGYGFIAFIVAYAYAFLFVITGSICFRPGLSLSQHRYSDFSRLMILIKTVYFPSTSFRKSRPRAPPA